MKASELDFGVVRLVAAAPTAGEELPPLQPGDEVELRRFSDGTIHLVAERHITQVKAADPRQSATFEAAIASAWPRVTTVRHVDPARTVLEVREFLSQIQWIGPLEIGVTKQILLEIRKLDRTRPWPDAAAVAAMLQDELVLPPFTPSLPSRIVVASGGGSQGPAFRLFGPRLVADVLPDKEGKLVVSRVGRRGGQTDRVALVGVATSFVNAGDVASLSVIGRAEIADLAGGTARYLDLWRRYNQAEQEWLERTARTFGLFDYKSVSENGDGDLQFNFEPSIKLAQVDRLAEAGSKRELVLEAASTAPPLFDVADEDAANEPEDDRPARTRPLAFAGSYIDIDRYGAWLLLRPEDQEGPDPPKAGVIYLAQRGSETVINRRRAAQHAIRTGLCQMPQLGLLLENQPVPLPRRLKHPAGTDATLAVFADGPTPAQLEAIEIAVNTPDVAIIQGPPGTGKTQVIAAIVKRLEELADPEENPAGSLLLTSFQHVAVENVARKVKPYGLPTLNMSQKRGKANAGRDPILEAWTKKTADYVDQARRTLPGSHLAQQYERLQRLLAGYSTGANGYQATARILEEAAQCASGLATPATCDRLRDLAASLHRERRDELDGDPKRERALRGVYGLRITKPGFEDDGPGAASIALRALDDAGRTLSQADRALLDTVADGAAKPTEALLAEIGALRERLLLDLAPDRRPLSIRRAPNMRVLEQLANAATEARDALTGSQAGLALILGDYANELRDDEHRMRATLLRYAASLAYTCQGSARGMRPLAPGKPPSGGYETVIVDEAARANPLDLFIPMAQARRRIILVGDHNQLPQSLEPDVERDLALTLEQQELVALRISLFQRLYEDLKERERTDGVRRTVLLNTQFRMHPALGKFVSDNFYGGVVESGLPAERYAHGLSAYRNGAAECVAAWLDVPAGPRLSNGRRRDAEDGETSRGRPSEVRRIARAVDDILREAPTLEIGVMSFYRRQVDALKSEMRRFGKSVSTGSVDEFQGRDFDVVFLSMTRCNEIEFRPRAGEEADAAQLRQDKTRRSRYGFLMLQNRMCVALSRQKRLLVVAGDGRMLEYPDAIEAVRPLVAFYRLCHDPERPEGVCL